MAATAFILTCERDRQLSDLLVEAIDREWPGVTPMVVLDTDKATETDIPGDIRDATRKLPYLRRVFDAWKLSPTDDIYIIDSDVFIYSEPKEFVVPSYQCAPGWDDSYTGTDVWASLGLKMPRVAPRFCGGTFSARRDMWSGRMELAYEYVRECVKRGYDRLPEAAVLCEQSLQAGLWRTTYEDNPLPADKYPVMKQTDEQVLWHIASSTKEYLYYAKIIGEYKHYVKKRLATQ